MLGVGTPGRIGRADLRASVAPFIGALDGVATPASAAYSTRRLRGGYSGAALRVRRSSDNTEQDIGFTPAGELDTNALTAFCGAPARPLDVATGSVGAYSTRRVRTAYTGPCMRVRRSSDNTEQDIGFTPSGDLDTVALLAFTGANSGFVTTWYDQSGLARHATQTTAASQPRIVNAGSVHTLNGRPTVDQVTVNGKLNIPVFSGMTSAIVSAVYAQAANNNGFAPWQFNQADHLPWINGIAYAGPFSATRPQFATWAAAANEVIVASAVQTGTAIAVYRNGTQSGTTQASAFALPSSQGNRTIFGGLSGSGFVSELIVMSAWDGGPTNRQILERSQAAYFGVTHADPISGFVTTWYDQSGNARNAVQATAANQPRIVNAGVVDAIGGRPAMRFVRSNSTVLNVPAFTLAPDRQFMVATVFQQAVTSAFARIWVAGGNNFSQGFLGTSSNGNSVLSIAGSTNISAPAVSILPTATSPIVVSQVFGTAGRAADVNAIRVNGGTDATLSGQTGPLSTGGYAIGNNGSTNAEGLNGTMAELVFVPGAATSTDRQSLERNQGAYFGIAVA